MIVGKIAMKNLKANEEAFVANRPFWIPFQKNIPT
jgi:hypothetical protein